MNICTAPTTIKCKRGKVGISPRVVGCKILIPCCFRKTKEEVAAVITADLAKVTPDPVIPETPE